MMLNSLYTKMLRLINSVKKEKNQRDELKKFTDSFFDDVRKFLELTGSFVDNNQDRLNPVFALQYAALSVKLVKRAEEYDELVERQQKQSNEIADQLKQLITD